MCDLMKSPRRAPTGKPDNIVIVVKWDVTNGIKTTHMLFERGKPYRGR